MSAVRPELSGATLPPLPAKLDDRALEAWQATLPPGSSLEAADPAATLRAREDLGSVPPPDVTSGTPAELPRDPSGYDLLGTVGRGGMGVVFRATQKALRREVAYKRPHRDEPAATRLFLSEALVTGYLEHPNIVPVHSLGEDGDGRVFFTMKLVQGTSWGKLLHPDGQPARTMDTEAHLRILIAVCHAVAFAHSRGIVHRDLKPDNVMIGDFGEVLLMDWGVAVEVGAEIPREPRAPHGSRSSLGGTPAYMAPEMAAGRTDLLSPRSDLYLLGAILHEILTGRAPHSGGTITAVLQRAMQSPPPDLDGIPPELAAICRRAMAREPADRHPDVRAFQAELEHYLQHRQSMLMAQVAAEEEARLEAEGSASGAGPARQLYERHAKLVARYEQALELWSENDAARAGLRRSRLAYARSALGRGDLGLAQSQLDHLGAGEDPEVLRIHEQVVQERRERERRETAARRTRSALRVVGVALFASLALGFIFVREERNQKMVEAMRADQNAARAQEQAAEAEAGRAREVELRRVSERRLAQSLIHEGDYLGSLFDWAGAQSRYLESWRTFVDAGADPLPARVAIWRHVDRFSLPLWVAPVAQQKIHAVAFSPDGRWLAVGSEENLCVIDVARGRIVVSRDLPALSLCWMPDSRHLVIGGTDVMIWDRVEDVPKITFQGSSNLIHRVAVTPDGSRVVAGGMAQVVWVWNAEDGTLLRTFEGHSSAIWVLSVTSDGNMVLSGASEGKSAEIRAWDLDGGEQIDAYLWDTQDCSSGAFTPDGRYALSGARDRILRVLDLEDKKELEALAGHDGTVTCVTPLPDGESALSGGDDRMLKLWDAENARLVAEFGGHERGVSALCVSSDGRLAASGDEGGRVLLWSLEKQRPTRYESIPEHSWMGSDASIGAVSPDGRLAATATSTGTVSLWDVATGLWLGALSPADPGPMPGTDPPSIGGTAFATGSTLVTDAPGPDEWRRGAGLTSIAFDDTGHSLHALRENGRAEHWELRDDSHTSMTVSTGVSVLSTDGRAVLQWPSGGQVRFVDAFTGEIRARHEVFAGRPGAIAWGPVPGQVFLATEPPPEPGEEESGSSVPATEEAPLRFVLWDLASAREVIEYDMKGVRAHQLLPSPDGTMLAVLGPEGSRLIEVATGTRLADLGQTSAGTGGWSRDGNWFLLQGEAGGALHLHDAGTGQRIRSLGEELELNWYCSPSAGRDLERIVSFPQSYGSSRQFLVWELGAGSWLRDRWLAVQPHLFPTGATELTPAGAVELVRWYAALERPELALSVASSVGTTALIQLDETEVTSASRDPLALVLARCHFDRGRGSSDDRARAAALVKELLARTSGDDASASRRLHLRLLQAALERPPRVPPEEG